MSEASFALVDSASPVSVRFKNARVKNMPLTICMQWNAGTACVSECVLKTLACRGFKAPGRGGMGSLLKIEAGGIPQEGGGRGAGRARGTQRCFGVPRHCLEGPFGGFRVETPQDSILSVL